jgi:hypothetical protein
MFKVIVQKIVVPMAGTFASLTLIGAVIDQPVQAVTFTSNLTVDGTNFSGNFVPLATSTYSYTKTEISPGSVGYKLLSLQAAITTPFLTKTYTLADFPQYTAELGLLTSLLPTQYQSVLANFQTGATYDYIGDGDFPPPDFVFSFGSQDVPNVSVFKLLFPQGGSVSFSSLKGGLPNSGSPIALTPESVKEILEPKYEEYVTDGVLADNSSAVPEPTTMIGMGLASAGLAIARRRKQKAG